MGERGKSGRRSRWRGRRGRNNRRRTREGPGWAEAGAATSHPRDARARAQRRLPPSGEAGEHTARLPCSKGVARTKEERPAATGRGAGETFAPGHSWPTGGVGGRGAGWSRGGQPEGPHRTLLRRVQCHRRVRLSQTANTASLIFPTSDESISGRQVKQLNSWWQVTEC